MQELERGLSANACCITVNAMLYRLTTEGYDALAQHAADSVENGWKTLRDSLSFVWEHYQRADGLLPHDYVTGWRDGDDYDRLLLTHSGTAERHIITANF